MFEDRSWDDLFWWGTRDRCSEGLSIVILKNYLIGGSLCGDYAGAVIEQGDSILIVR